MGSRRLSSWFMRNIILPNNEIIDTPGYIAIQQFSKETGRFYLREVMLPEGLMAEIENAFVRKFGKAGKQAVYRAGKEWGYWFCAGSGLPRKADMPKEGFLSFMDSFMKLLEAEYTTKVVATVGYDQDTLTFMADDLLVCSKNGHGYFLAGTLTGAWAYLTGREDVEGAHPKCQGRGDKGCVIICGPDKITGGYPHRFSARIERRGGLDAGYIQLNRVKRLPYAKNSLKDMLESRYIAYEGGFFHMRGEKLLLNEASFVYFLEKELGRLRGGSELLFDTTRRYFIAYMKGSKTTTQRIGDILPALGWGDFSFVQDGVFVHAYPYSSHYKSTTFPLIRGMLSGLLSSAAGRPVKLRSARPMTTDNEFQLEIR